MRQPTDISSFYPWSGMISVGILVSGTPVYIRNLTNRTLYCSNGGNDGLYPAAKMQPMMQFVMSHGVNIYYTSYDTAGHNWGYMPLELQWLPDRIQNYAREPFRTHIYWEASDLNYGRIDWLEITELDKLDQPAIWHDEINYKLVD